jgi:uncharacterized protein (TIGR01777 family)
MAKVVVTGATGTIGHALVGRLIEHDYEVLALSRNPESARSRLPKEARLAAWSRPQQEPPPSQALAGADAVVHLLGEPVAQRWTDAARRKIHDSRVLATRQLVAGLRGLSADQRPSVLISASAAGYYGPRGDEPVDESSPPGQDFLAGVTAAWEQEATAAEELMRVLVTRTGVVLSPSGGALATMLPFFKLGLGGPVAGGRQYVPWIHLADVVGAIIYCLEARDASGPVNLTSPAPVRNREFSHALGRAIGRPAILPVPAFGLRLLYGEMATVVTTGQRVLPRALERLGYAFAHPDLEPAFRDVLGR